MGTHSDLWISHSYKGSAVQVRNSERKDKLVRSHVRWQPWKCTAKKKNAVPQPAACDDPVSSCLSPPDCRCLVHRVEQALPADYTTFQLECSTVIMTLHDSTSIRSDPRADHNTPSVLQLGSICMHVCSLDHQLCRLCAQRMHFKIVWNSRLLNFGHFSSKNGSVNKLTIFGFLALCGTKQEDVTLDFRKLWWVFFHVQHFIQLIKKIIQFY